MKLLKIGTLITTSALLFSACDDSSTGPAAESSSSVAVSSSAADISSSGEGTSSTDNLSSDAQISSSAEGTSSDSETASSSSEEISSSSVSSDSQNTSSSSQVVSGGLDSDLYGTWLYADSESQMTYVFNDDGSMSVDVQIDMSDGNGMQTFMEGNGTWSTNADQLSIIMSECMMVDMMAFMEAAFAGESFDFTLSEDCSDTEPNTNSYRVDGNTLYAPDPETGEEVEMTKQ